MHIRQLLSSFTNIISAKTTDKTRDKIIAIKQRIAIKVNFPLKIQNMIQDVILKNRNVEEILQLESADVLSVHCCDLYRCLVLVLCKFVFLVRLLL